jgi:acyl-CoA dehydrogenase
MNVTRSATFEQVLATAHDFAEQELRPVALAFDESEEFPRALLDRAAELGLTCYDMPVEHGGGGIESLLECCEIIEELTWGDSPIGLVIGQGGFFAGPLMAMGTQEQQARWMPALCGPRPPACALAITEPEAGSDAAAITTTARRVDGGYVLDGRKRYIGNAPVADLCMVFAQLQPGSRAKGITAFVLQNGDEGFIRGERLPKLGSRCFPAGEVVLERCFVPDDRRIGDEGQGFYGLMACFDRGRVQVAANALGIGRAALEHGVAYAREREAFGRPISEFQAVTFRLADAKMKLDQARLMTHHAAHLADAGRPFGTEAAMAKLAASEAAWFAAWAASQTLGASGYIRTSPVQKLLRDARLEEIWDGTSDIMRVLIARDLFRPSV